MKPAYKFIFFICLLFGSKGYCQRTYVAADLDSLKRVLKTAKPDTNKAKVIYYIANIYVYSNPDSGMTYAKTGLSLVKNLGWQNGVAMFYTCMGNLNSDNGNYAKAIEFYTAAYNISKLKNRKFEMASNLNNIGSVYQRQGNDTKSLVYSFAALKIAEQVKAQLLIATLYFNISNVYFAQQDFKKAEEYNLKALKKYETLGNKNGLARVNTNIANQYIGLGKFKDAVVYYQKSLDLYHQTGNKMDEAATLSQMGVAFQDDIDKLLSYFLSAQQIFDKNNPLSSNSISNIGNIGEAYFNVFSQKMLVKGKSYTNIPADYASVSRKAEEYLSRAVKMSRQVHDIDNLSYFSEILAMLQEKTGAYKEALENVRLSKSISDSLYSQESKNKIATLEARYTFQKKEDEYKQKQQLAEFKTRQVFLYAALIIIIVSSILLYFLNHSRISHLRLKNELQRKKAEEETKELLYKNKLSESELKAIRAQMNPHFIFNVLNSIESYIVENDSKTASRLVQKFASLSRLILENSTQSMVTADREWKALKLYTELEAMRFSNQFSYSFYADPLIDLSKLLLPPMLIQPLIENSIHHGMRNSTAEGNNINISMEQTQTEVYFVVEDNGIGIDESEKFKTFSAIKSKSIGLSAIRERIEIFNVMNEDHHASFEIRKKTAEEGTGTIAKLVLPKIYPAE